MPKFFIERPIFAWVIAIVIMLAGLLAIKTLPVEQYPRIAPPTISIRTSYPGASAATLENSVTQTIEQKLTGIDHLRYFSSTSDSTGNMEIKLTFDTEADPDIAQVQVQNKISATLNMMPDEVKDQGFVVAKANRNFMIVIALYSDDNSMDQYAITDYANSKMVDPISRVPGVGDVTVFGQQYSMRIWLNPEKLHSYGLSTSDVINAVKAQNVDISAGQIGGNPAVQGQQLNATVTARTKLKTAEEFEQVLLIVKGDGSQVRLKDVARVELGVQSYDIKARFNGKPGGGIAISLASGANALKTGNLIKAKVAELQEFMPKGMQVAYPYDTTPFVKLSIEEVVKTLIEAIVLVFFVMFLFLQNFRATLIPTIAVPVVLMGTFGVLSAFGFTINTLTMFAMVLAIGLLVDDAIVVVENVERVMGETGLSPKEATKQSMQQITGALVGIALVLSAVFVPMAFFSGSTGAIYRQFSITIVSAMALSVLVALVLTPALCATMLKPIGKGHYAEKTGFFGWFNTAFDSSKKFYGISVEYVSTRAVRFLVVYLVLIGGMIYLMRAIPTSFLPNEDQGVMYMTLSTPPGATSERTFESVLKVEKHFLEDEKENVEAMFSVQGFSFAGRGQNAALGFVRLKDWSLRKRPDQSVSSVAARAMKKLSSVQDARIFAFYPPPIRELGNAMGFDFQLVDRGGLGHEELVKARDYMLSESRKNPSLSGVRPNGLEDVPQFKLDIDYEKARVMGVSISEINSTLKTAWGSSYVNEFIHEGRVKKVFIQGDAPYRMLPEDINRWYVKNNKGDMVSFGAFTTSHWVYGSQKLERYNGVPSQEIQGAPSQGVSSGEAMTILEEMAKKLPEGIGLEWTGLSYEERMAGSQTPLLYTLSLLIVFLSLAALYESWSIPFSVMLIVPIGIFGTVMAAKFAGLTNDVYFQVSLLTTMGLSAKNAILIVEFAKSLHEQGLSIIAAAKQASITRLRPIIMTSMAFILGVLPLAIANGAGSASQNAIGIGVIGGMAAATFIAIAYVPLFFIVISKRSVMIDKEESEGASDVQ